MHAVKFSNNKRSLLKNGQTDSDKLLCRFNCFKNLIVKKKTIIKL